MLLAALSLADTFTACGVLVGLEQRLAPLVATDDEGDPEPDPEPEDPARPSPTLPLPPPAALASR